MMARSIHVSDRVMSPPMKGPFETPDGKPCGLIAKVPDTTIFEIRKYDDDDDEYFEGGYDGERSWSEHEFVTGDRKLIEEYAALKYVDNYGILQANVTKVTHQLVTKLALRKHKDNENERIWTANALEALNKRKDELESRLKILTTTS